MPELTHTLTATLQSARKACRISQLELSLRVGVSQRHVSFVESGRAKPSRGLLIEWLQELDAPLSLRNAAMLQAGYAPIYSESQMSAPAMLQATQATQQLLRSHDPMPAFVIDANWNLIHLNRGGRWLAVTLMPWAAALLNDADNNTAKPINMLDMLCHPEGFTKHLANLAEVGPSFLAHLRDDASTNPALAAKAEAFARLLGAHLGNQNTNTAMTRQLAPVLVSRFATEHGELSFFSMFTTFGTPQDITLASLRIEHMFAADDHTRTVLHANVPANGS